MRTVIGLLVMLIFPLMQWAQSKCISWPQTEMEMRADPAYARGVDSLESMAQQLAEGWLPARDVAFPTLTVPIVVHVLYRTESQNISTDQIHAQIEVLNRDFAALNEDLSKVPEVFRSLAGATNIRFELADRDPDGNFTNGITRKQTTVENIGSQAIYHRPERGGVEPWPQPHYLNVWVCELEGNSLGFAILPSAKMSERDGIVMSPRAFGLGGTAQEPYHLGRTFVHEVGHYFGLRHLWGNDDASCNSTDYINDTPVQLKENFGCSTFPTYSCVGEPNGDMFMNYMDYGNDSCMLLFTQQQVELMHLVLLTSRKTLFHSQGVTGVAIKESAKNRINVYPNPVSERVLVELLFGASSLMKVFNAAGALVCSWQQDQSMHTLNLTGWHPGLYLLQTELGTIRFLVR